MKRYPEFVYNAIDTQNIVFANQLKMSDWNNIINVLKTQANANTTFLETWTRWFLGTKDYTDEDVYTDTLENELGRYDCYYDYLKAEFNRIDSKIIKEIADRKSDVSLLHDKINTEIAERRSDVALLYDKISTEVITLNNVINTAIEVERYERTLQDGLIRDEINLEETTRIQEDNKIKNSLEAETNARASNDGFLQNQIDEEIDRSKDKDQNLQDQISTNKTDINKKIDKDFTNILPASSIHKDDSIIIRCGDTTYTITIEYLAELINTEIDYFKGYYTSLEGLIAKYPAGEDGDYAFVGSKDDEQYHMYVWDNRDGGAWEETISGQYVGTSTFDTFQKRIQEGSVHVGAIKANVENAEDIDPLLVNIEINGETFVLPSIALEFLSEAIEGAYNLGAIKINGNVWNISSGNDTSDLEFEFSDKNVEGATELGSIKVGTNVWNVAKLSDVLNKLAEFNNSANAYTDTKAGEALASAKSYADTKATSTLNSANSHSDSKDTETLNSAKAYADTKGTETLNSAKSYADTKGTEALNAAKAYADAIKKSILGEGISETYDTLKEIQNWMEGDGVNASELSQAVAGKQDKLTAGSGISISADGVISISYPDGDEEVY